MFCLLAHCLNDLNSQGWTGLGWTEVRSVELNPNVLRGWQGPSDVSHHLMPLRYTLLGYGICVFQAASQLLQYLFPGYLCKSYRRRC